MNNVGNKLIKSKCLVALRMEQVAGPSPDPLTQTDWERVVTILYRGAPLGQEFWRRMGWVPTPK